MLPLSGERKPAPYLQTDFRETSGRFSPDGRWVAYQSDETGRSEVYVRGFPAAGGKWQVSDGGGAQPRWRRDGRELFYLSTDRGLMAVEVSGGGDSFKAGAPRPLFETRIGTDRTPSLYDVTADGQRFLVNTTAEEDDPAPVTVVTNWAAGLKR